MKPDGLVDEEETHSLRLYVQYLVSKWGCYCASTCQTEEMNWGPFVGQKRNDRIGDGVNTPIRMYGRMRSIETIFERKSPG